MAITRSEAVSAIQRRLGMRTNLDTDIATEIQLAQTVLESEVELPWFLLAKDSSLVTVAETAEVAYPSDFLRLSDGGLWLKDGTEYTQLDKDSFQAIHGDSDLEGSGTPSYFAELGLNFTLFKTPDAIYNLTLYYYAAATVLSSDITNAWLTYAPDLLISFTGMRMAESIRDKDAMGIFSSEYGKAFTRYIKSLVAHDEAGKVLETRD